jgi:serine/threonine protein kinase
MQESEAAYAELEDLVRRMLALDPARRISPEEALAHPFLARIDPPRT